MYESLKKYSLPKKTIIKKKSEFNEIFRNGIVFKSRYFIAFVIYGDEKKVGFATEKKCNSVIRNRLKRRTRELWRTLHGNFSFTGKVILYAKKTAAKEKFECLKKDFISLLQQIDNKKPTS